MVEADFGGEYLSIETTNDGDIVTIVGRPEFGELVFQGKTKKVTNVPVQVKDKLLVYTPTNKAGRNLVKAWGKEMDDWNGKQFTVLHIEEKIVVRPIIERPTYDAEKVQ